MSINYKIQSNIYYAYFHLTFLWFFIFQAIMKISSCNHFLVLRVSLSNSSIKLKGVEVEMKKWFTVWKKEKKQNLIMYNRINALWFSCSYLLLCDLFIGLGVMVSTSMNLYYITIFFSNITYSNSISSIFHFFKGKWSTNLNSVENAILLVIVLINLKNILSGL